MKKFSINDDTISTIIGVPISIDGDKTITHQRLSILLSNPTMLLCLINKLDCINGLKLRQCWDKEKLDSKQSSMPKLLNLEIKEYWTNIVSNLALFFADCYAKENNDEEMQETLIRIKYSLAFISPYFENIFLASKFNILPPLVFSGDTIKELYEFPSNINSTEINYIDGLSQNFLISIYNQYLNELIAIDDEDLANDLVRMRVIAFYLQAALTFMDKFQIEAFSEKFEEEINSKKYKSIYTNTGTAIKLIRTAFYNAYRGKNTKHPYNESEDLKFK
jgi:hypothetical protein